MTLFISACALAFGLYIVLYPIRAARIWGWEHMDRLSHARRILYLRAFRAMGACIGLAGMLFGLLTPR
jgi:hypothetical protein